MSEQINPTPGQEAVKARPKGRVSQCTIDALDGILEIAHPTDLIRDFTNILLGYIEHECETLPDDFKETMRNYTMVLEWLEVIEQEMDAEAPD